MSFWGHCEKHKVPLEIRYAENNKSDTYCPECNKEQSERLKSMFKDGEKCGS
jgi:ribosomal protein L37AE/L43A